MARNTDGLTDLEWAGTLIPTASHPVALDTDIRGGLHYTTDEADCRIGNITGQRLQKGMLVYVDAAHDFTATPADTANPGFAANTLYQLEGPDGATFSRDSNGDLQVTPSGGTARAVEAGDWSELETGGDGGLAVWTSGESYEVGDFVYRAIDTAFDSTTATRTEYFIFAARTAHNATGDPDMGVAGNYPVLGGNDQWRQVGLNAGGQRLLNVGVPSTDDDAANKEYVDRLPHAGGRFEDLSDVNTFTSTATATSATPVTATGGTPTNADTVAAQSDTDNTLLNVNIPANSGDFNVVGQHVSVFLSTAGGTDTEIVGTLEDYSTIGTDRDVLSIRITSDQMRDISARSQVLNTTAFPQFEFGINTITEVRTHAAREDAFLAIHRDATGDWEVTNDREVAQESLDTILDYSEHNTKFFQNHAGALYHIGVQTTEGAGINTWNHATSISGRTPASTTENPRNNNFTVNSSDEPVFSVDAPSNQSFLMTLRDADAYLGVYITKSDTTVLPRGFYIGQFSVLGGTPTHADITLDNFTHADGTAVENIDQLNVMTDPYRDLEFTIYELTEAHIDDVTTWRGEYVSTGTDYAVGDVVWSAAQDALYRCTATITNSNDGAFPDASFWTALSDTEQTSANHIIATEGGGTTEVSFPSTRADGLAALVHGDWWFNQDSGRMYRWDENLDLWTELNDAKRDSGEYTIALTNNDVITGRVGNDGAGLLVEIEGVGMGVNGSNVTTATDESIVFTISDGITGFGAQQDASNAVFNITFTGPANLFNERTYALRYHYIDGDGNDASVTIFEGSGANVFSSSGSALDGAVLWNARQLANAFNQAIRDTTTNTAGVNATAAANGRVLTVTIPAADLDDNDFAGSYDNVEDGVRFISQANHVPTDVAYAVNGDPARGNNPHTITIDWASRATPGTNPSETFEFFPGTADTQQEVAEAIQSAFEDNALFASEWDIGDVTVSGTDFTITITQATGGSVDADVTITQGNLDVGFETNVTSAITAGSRSDRITISYEIDGTRYPAAPNSYVYDVDTVTGSTHNLRDALTTALNEIFGPSSFTGTLADTDVNGLTIMRPTDTARRFEARAPTSAEVAAHGRLTSTDELVVAAPTPEGDEAESFSFSYEPGDGAPAATTSASVIATQLAAAAASDNSQATSANFEIVVGDMRETVSIRYAEDVTDERDILRTTADAIESQFPTLHTDIDSNLSMTMYTDPGINLEVVSSSVTVGSVLGQDLSQDTFDVVFDTPTVVSGTLQVSIPLATGNNFSIRGNTTRALVDSLVGLYNGRAGVIGQAARLNDTTARFYGITSGITAQARQRLDDGITTGNSVWATISLAATNTVDFTVSRVRHATSDYLSEVPVRITDEDFETGGGHFIRYNADGHWELADAAVSGLSAVPAVIYDADASDPADRIVQRNITGSSTGGDRAATMDYVDDTNGVASVSGTYQDLNSAFDSTGDERGATIGYVTTSEAELVRSVQEPKALRSFPVPVTPAVESGGTTYFSRRTNADFEFGTEEAPDDGFVVFHRDEVGADNGELVFRLRKPGRARIGDGTTPSGTFTLANTIASGQRVVSTDSSDAVVWSGVVLSWHDDLWSYDDSANNRYDYIAGRIHVDYYADEDEGADIFTNTTDAVDLSFIDQMTTRTGTGLDFRITGNVADTLGQIVQAEDNYPVGFLRVSPDGSLESVNSTIIPPSHFPIQRLGGYPHPDTFEVLDWRTQNADGTVTYTGYDRIPPSTQNINLLQQYSHDDTMTAQQNIDAAWPNTGSGDTPPNYSPTLLLGNGFRCIAYRTHDENYYVTMAFNKGYFNASGNMFRYIAPSRSDADSTTDANYPRVRQVVGGLDNDGNPAWTALMRDYETAPGPAGTTHTEWIYITLDGLRGLNDQAVGIAAGELFEGWSLEENGGQHDFDFAGQSNADAYEALRNWFGNGLYLAEDAYEEGYTTLEADGSLRSVSVRYDPQREYQVDDFFFTEDAVDQDETVVPAANANQFYRVTTAIAASTNDRVWPAANVQLISGHGNGFDIHAVSNTSDDVEISSETDTSASLPQHLTQKSYVDAQVDHVEQLISDNAQAIKDLGSDTVETTWTSYPFQPANANIGLSVTVRPTGWTLVTNGTTVSGFTTRLETRTLSAGNPIVVKRGQRRYTYADALGRFLEDGNAANTGANVQTGGANTTRFAHVGFRDAAATNEVFSPDFAATTAGAVTVTTTSSNAVDGRAFLVFERTDDREWTLITGGFPNTVTLDGTNAGHIEAYYFDVANANVGDVAAQVSNSSTSSVSFYDGGTRLSSLRSHITSNDPHVVEEVLYRDRGEDVPKIELVESVSTTNQSDVWGDYINIVFRQIQADRVVLEPDSHITVREELAFSVDVTNQVFTIPNAASHPYTLSTGTETYFYGIDPTDIGYSFGFAATQAVTSETFTYTSADGEITQLELGPSFTGWTSGEGVEINTLRVINNATTQTLYRATETITAGSADSQVSPDAGTARARELWEPDPFDNDVVLLTIDIADTDSNNGRYLAEISGFSLSSGSYPIFELDNIRSIEDNEVFTFTPDTGTEVTAFQVSVQRMFRTGGRLPEAPAAPSTTTEYNLQVDTSGDATWVADTGGGGGGDSLALYSNATAYSTGDFAILLDGTVSEANTNISADTLSLSLQIRQSGMLE